MSRERLGRGLDTAIAAVDDTIEQVRYNTLEPADLASVIAGVRELFWHTTTLTAALGAVYGRTAGLGHDHGHDPAVSVAVIVEQLATVTGALAVIDDALADVHNHAAHLYRARC